MSKTVALAMAISTSLMSCLTGCSNPSPPTDIPHLSKSMPLSSESIERIERFCSDCHQMPDPSTFPKSRWPEEVFQGFQFYVDSERRDLQEPNRQDTVRYFQHLAPDKLVVPRADSFASTQSHVRFIENTRLSVPFENPATSLLE